MIIVTGATGFIGSNLLAELELRQYKGLVAVDSFGVEDKWRNISKRIFPYLVSPQDIDSFIESNVQKIKAIIHLGGISSTTENNVDSIVENNIKLTIRMYEFCKNNHIRFIYASSASTYGDGGKGYIDSDDIEYLNQLSPLNPYAWSKNYVDKYISYDRYVNKNKSLSVGLKFFNVYGPNEYHKGLQASVIFHFFLQMLQNNTVNLFKSNCADFKDGQQKRDFVYVRDCVDVIIWMLEHQEIIGLFNVGTGCASSFLEVVESIKKACHIECKIHYIDMPEKLKKHYQNFTEANLTKLRSVGYTKEFTSLEAGISQYVNEFLNKKNKRYEPNYI